MKDGIKIYPRSEILALVNKKHSCITLKKCNRKIEIQAKYLKDIKAGIKHALDKGLNRFDCSLNGILLDYNKVVLLADSGRIFGRCGEFLVTINAEFFVFQPEIGNLLEGEVNAISKTHIGCLIHKTFNGMILKSDDDIEDWIDKSITIGDKIVFRIHDHVFSGQIPYIEGKLPTKSQPKLSEKDEKSEDCSTILEQSIENGHLSEDNCTDDVKISVQEPEKNSKSCGPVNKSDADKTSKILANDIHKHSYTCDFSPSKKKKKKDKERHREESADEVPKKKKAKKEKHERENLSATSLTLVRNDSSPQKRKKVTSVDDNNVPASNHVNSLLNLMPTDSVPCPLSLHDTPCSLEKPEGAKQLIFNKDESFKTPEKSKSSNKRKAEESTPEKGVKSMKISENEASPGRKKKKLEHSIESLNVRPHETSLYSDSGGSANSSNKLKLVKPRKDFTEFSPRSNKGEKRHRIVTPPPKPELDLNEIINGKEKKQKKRKDRSKDKAQERQKNPENVFNPDTEVKFDAAVSKNRGKKEKKCSKNHRSEKSKYARLEEEEGGRESGREQHGKKRTADGEFTNSCSDRKNDSDNDLSHTKPAKKSKSESEEDKVRRKKSKGPAQEPNQLWKGNNTIPPSNQLGVQDSFIDTPVKTSTPKAGQDLEVPNKKRKKPKTGKKQTVSSKSEDERNAIINALLEQVKINLGLSDGSYNSSDETISSKAGKNEKGIRRGSSSEKSFKASRKKKLKPNVEGGTKSDKTSSASWAKQN